MVFFHGSLRPCHPIHDEIVTKPEIVKFCAGLCSSCENKKNRFFARIWFFLSVFVLFCACLCYGRAKCLEDVVVRSCSQRACASRQRACLARRQARFCLRGLSLVLFASPTIKQMQGRVSMSVLQSSQTTTSGCSSSSMSPGRPRDCSTRPSARRCHATLRPSTRPFGLRLMLACIGRRSLASNRSCSGLLICCATARTLLLWCMTLRRFHSKWRASCLWRRCLCTTRLPSTPT